MLTVIGIMLMMLGLFCVLAACSMELSQELDARSSLTLRRARKKAHRMTKHKKAA